MDTSKYFFTEEVIKYWNRLPREAFKSPSLEGFNDLQRVVDWVVLDLQLD